MGGIDPQILNDFIAGSKNLVRECVEILEKVEGPGDRGAFLSDYANRVDRIMGAARQMAPEGKHALHLIADCAGLCKSLGYQAAKLVTHHEYTTLTVAFLLDATEMIDEMLDRIEQPYEKLRVGVQATLVDRLKWISSLSQKISPREQKADSPAANEIDQIIRKLLL